jgi:hypothetical protein
LHALCQRIADEANVIAFLNRQVIARCRSGEKGKAAGHE